MSNQCVLYRSSPSCILSLMQLAEVPEFGVVEKLFAQLYIRLYGSPISSRNYQRIHSYLGENVASLSGGRKRGIAIARALYQNPDVLILHEATSSLDSISERCVQETIGHLREQGKTVILIAHRLSTVMHADKIVVIEQGKLIEEGSPFELLTNEKAYFRLWASQMPLSMKTARLAPMDLYQISANGDQPTATPDETSLAT